MQAGVAGPRSKILLTELGNFGESIAENGDGIVICRCAAFEVVN